MLTVVSYNLMHCRLIRRVEPFSCPRVQALSRATRSYPEGVACCGAMDGAALVDGHGGGPFHDVAAANRAAIHREHRYGWLWPETGPSPRG